MTCPLAPLFFYSASPLNAERGGQEDEGVKDSSDKATENGVCLVFEKVL